MTRLDKEHLRTIREKMEEASDGSIKSLEAPNLIKQLERLAEEQENYENDLKIYSHYFTMNFKEFWETTPYALGYKTYTEEILLRLENSTDRKSMIDLEVIKFDIEDAFIPIALPNNDDELPIFLRNDGIRLGYLLAISGQEPTILDLINGVSSSIRLFTLDETIRLDISSGTSKHLRTAIQKLLAALLGYTNSPKIKFLKSLNSEGQRTKKLCNSPLIPWNGNLKEFAELIDQLQDKGWITVNDGELNQAVKALCEVFDFSNTKKTAESNTQASLPQILKPSEREAKIYTKRYLKQFDLIKPNNLKPLV